MKKSDKINILDLMNNMRILHKELVGSSGALLTDYLATCQQAAISVGGLLEKEAPDGLQSMIDMLEQYAESCYQITVKGLCVTEDVSRLDDLVNTLTERIEKIAVKIKIAFFPYKAEMWDSLESIYLAVAADSDCEAKVIPIPYYEMDQTVGKWVLKYDGADFPTEIPIQFFKEYDVKAEQPDIAYIHNPYDNYNLVTSVRPDYYSFELKKYVGKLVYIPYYVCAGKLSDGHKDLPCYRHVDYIVLQSKQAKDDCRGMYYYDKILSLGSPKLDRVINKCSEGVNIPEEWKSIINGRRTLMLNSTIDDLLRYNEKIFVKLRNFFEYIRANKKIAIIWRPHPLYEATIRAMRPELLQQYEQLKRFFEENKIGVLDTTPDISSTVAATDGYIGAPSSSVINLFGAAGKPAFLFDDKVTEIVAEEESKVLMFDSCCFVGDKLMAYSHYPDFLFEIKLQDGTGILDSTIRPITSISKNRLYTYPYWYMAALLGKLYFSPLSAPELAQYDPGKNEVKDITVNTSFRNTSFYKLQACGDSIFLLPAKHELVAEYSIKKQKWIYHDHGPELLFEGAETGMDGGITGEVSYKKAVYFSTGVTNRILKITAGTGKYQIIDLGTSSVTKNIPIFLLGASDEGLWLEILSNEYREPDTAGIYLAPWDCLNSIEGWKYFPLMSESKDRYEDNALKRFFFRAYDVDGYMVICPGRYEHIFRISRQNGEVSLLAEDFWKSLPQGHSMTLKVEGSTIKESAVAADEKRILVQRFADRRMALINVSEDTFTEFVPQLKEEDFKEILKGNEGFRKDGQDGYFAMVESEFYSLNYFLNKFVKTGWEEIKERQIDALESFAANLDGSCGKKVHDFMMKTL